MDSVPRSEDSRSEVHRVFELLIPGTNLWNEVQVRRAFYEESTAIPSEGGGDELKWSNSKNGLFSVQGVYWTLNNSRFLSARDPFWKAL